MAEMTYASAKSAAATYVAAAKQAAAWSKTTNNFAGLIDKIGKTITIDGTEYFIACRIEAGTDDSTYPSSINKNSQAISSML